MDDPNSLSIIIPCFNEEQNIAKAIADLLYEFEDCQFSYEALEDIDPDSVLGDPLEHFIRHKLKLLSIAEQKIMKGYSHDGILQIHSNDLVVD